MKIADKPKMGWGTLEPDLEISPETLEIISRKVSVGSYFIDI